MLEIDRSVSVTFMSGDPHFPREIGASPRCNNLRNKREKKIYSQLNDECQEIISNNTRKTYFFLFSNANTGFSPRIQTECEFSSGGSKFICAMER